MRDGDHERFMRCAIRLSREKMQAGAGGPFGAVIVKDGVVIGEGWNCVTSTNDPTAHAEIVAIREACRALGSFALHGCTLYTSCEPCPMCLAAAYWARIERLFYANARADAASIGFDDAFLYDQVALPLDRQAIPADRLLAPEARLVFDEWAAKPDKVPY
jgi:guanine deaminase